MTTDALYRAIHATPFRPFILRMVDGERLGIRHPDFIIYSRGARMAGVWREDQSAFLDIDLLLVMALEYPADRRA